MVLLFILGLLLVPVGRAAAQPSGDEWMQVSDLRGTWRFQLGDDPGWADPAASDKEWETIFVPSRWEEEGYWGYDGYAWYRNRFLLPDGATKYALYLDVGRIDDVNAVYVNGHFIGSAGSFPPDYKTAFHVFNRYPIPARFLRTDGGYNVVAIRVFDNGGEGGLLEGRPGLYANLDEPALALDLSGPWQFRTGDRPEWRTGPLDPKRWDTVTVPGRWERQGFPDYDGFAWYRLSFVPPENLRGEPLVVLLGKIDDFDETYLNGERIGATGRMGSEHIEGWEWQAMRNYPIPEGLLRFGEENTLAVRVYDGLLDGGIFEGPIGITYLGEAGHWEEPPSEHERKPTGPFSRFLDWLFNN